MNRPRFQLTSPEFAPRRRRGAPVLLPALGLALGCATSATEEAVAVSCSSLDVRVLPVDVWGRELPGATATPGSLTVAEGVKTLQATAEGWVGTTVTLELSDAAPGGLAATATDGAQVAVALGQGCTRDLYVGLDHPIYASTGRAPKEGNKVTLLPDGERYWQAVYDDLVARPTARVNLTTWWWQADFELIRGPNHTTEPESARRQNTMMELLQGREPARVAVARFAEGLAGGMAYLNSDPELRAFGESPDDGVEVMLQSNRVEAPFQGTYTPEPVVIDFAARVAEHHAAADFPAAPVQASLEAIEAASYHQKGLVIGGEVAFISGMNVKSTDWDTNAHEVFDPKRMIFVATTAERVAVANKEVAPDKGPRKDYGIRVEGPAARDADDILRVRWDHGIAVGAMFAGDQTPFELLPPSPAVGNTSCQIVTTLPPPIAERSIFETQAKAVRQATDFIYIEDQYFRAPMLDELIAAAMREQPDLHLVVVTKPVSLSDGGKKWTVISDQTFRDEFPDRYLLLALETYDEVNGVHHFVPIDTHSKITFVDDDYLCVGSANKNNRGYLYEGELNAAVYDRAMVSPARLEVLQNLVGAERAGELSATSTGREILTLLRELAEANAAFKAAVEADPESPGKPAGFVYPLAFSPEYLVEVGPDVF